MKIVYVARKFLEGFAYQDNELADMHARLGHEVTVITSQSDDSSLYFDMSLIKKSKAVSSKKKSADFRIIRLPLKHKVNFRFWEFKNLISTLEEIEPDLIFFHGSPMFCLLDLAKYKKKHPGITLVMDCHNDYNNAGHGIVSRVLMHKIIYRSIIYKTRNEVDLYYYLAPNIRIFMKDMYRIPDRKLKFLPRGGILENMDFANEVKIRREIREQLHIGTDDVVVISGGKLDSKKMSHHLCEAINDLNKPNVHLILFGTVDKNYEEQLQKAVNGNPKIHLIGWIASENVYNYFFASDIACFPGGHSVMWEQAICCGLPLIVKDWYKGMYYLNVKRNVLLLEDSDVRYIKPALSSLIDHPELRVEMSLNARNEVQKFFSYRRIAESILADTRLKIKNQ